MFLAEPGKGGPLQDRAEVGVGIRSVNQLHLLSHRINQKYFGLFAILAGGERERMQ